MSFIKNALFGFLILVIITTGFNFFIGSMNQNYNQNLQIDDNSQSYLNDVQNVTSSLEASLRMEDVSQGSGFVGDIQRFIAGGKLTANVLYVSFTAIPKLLYSGVESSLEPLGLTWVAPIIIAAIAVTIAFIAIKFVLGRGLGD